MRRVPLLVLVLLSLIVPRAASAIVTVEPARPRAGESFRVIKSGFWPGAGAPRVREVFLAAPDRIVVTCTIDELGGLSASPYKAIAEIPPLPAGTYRVAIRVHDGVLQPLGHVTVNVTGTLPRPLVRNVSPVVGGTSGGAVVSLEAECAGGDCSGAQVFFGEHESPNVAIDGTRIRAVTPAVSRVGLVDLTVRRGGEQWFRPSAFTFVAPGEYETILLPSFTDAVLSGSHGSRWKVDHGVLNRNAVMLEANVDFLHVETCAGCNQLLAPGLVSAIPTMPSFNRPPNWLVHVRKPASDALSWSMRVRDISRQSETWGTEVPIVRAAQFRTRLDLFDVPLDERFRQTLRIFARPQGTACCNDVVVRFYSVADGSLLHETTARLQHTAGSVATLAQPGLGSPDFPAQPESASLDSLGAIPQLAGHDRVRIEVETAGRKIWAYVSITNNATQHVTVVSPW